MPSNKKPSLTSWVPAFPVEKHFAIVLSYLKASGQAVALLLNYAEPTLAIRRFGNKIFYNGEPRKPGERENLVKLLEDGSH